MDRRFWLAFVCISFVAKGAPAQFAVDRNATPPTAAPSASPPIGLPGFVPEGTPAPAPAPARPPAMNTPGAPTPTPTPPSAPAHTKHALAITPQAGEYLVTVKSYIGTDAMALAERLAADIRTKHNVPVYLFEYHSEEKQKLQAEQEAVRRRAYDEAMPFLQKKEEMRKKAEMEGRVFVDDGPHKVRVQKLLTTIPEQWAVLVGGYKDMDMAKKAADVIHTWPEPKDAGLMDRVTYPAKVDGKVVEWTAAVNPYVTAMVVRNPSLPRANDAAADPALWRWNEGEPMSVLNCKKPYTMIVKSFSVPVVASGHEQSQSVMQASGSDKTVGANNAQRMAITAIQARNLAQMLRDLKDGQGKPIGFDSYVLHMKTGSIVCVGQFDTQDDPAMADVAKRITQFQMNMTKDAKGQQVVMPGERSFFDQISVLKIPRK